MKKAAKVLRMAARIVRMARENTVDCGGPEGSSEWNACYRDTIASLLDGATGNEFAVVGAKGPLTSDDASRVHRAIRLVEEGADRGGKMKKVTHILDWRSVCPGSYSKTLCGRETRRVIGVRVGPEVANNPHDATCLRCRKIRDGR